MLSDLVQGSGPGSGLRREHADHDQPGRPEPAVQLVQRRRRAPAVRTLGGHEETHQHDLAPQASQGQRPALDPAVGAPVGRGSAEDRVTAHETDDGEESGEHHIVIVG